MIVVETNDLVGDLPNSVLDEVVGKCEEEREARSQKNAILG